jgi:hypothetical protein
VRKRNDKVEKMAITLEEEKIIKRFVIAATVVVATVAAGVGIYVATRGEGGEAGGGAGGGGGGGTSGINGTIVNVNLDPSTAVYGERLTVTVTVRNTSDTAGEFNIGVWCQAPPDYPIGDFKQAEYVYMTSGETETRSFNFYPTFNTNFVKITVELRKQEDLRTLDTWVTQIALTG